MHRFLCSDVLPFDKRRTGPSGLKLWSYAHGRQVIMSLSGAGLAGKIELFRAIVPGCELSGIRYGAMWRTGFAASKGVLSDAPGTRSCPRLRTPVKPEGSVQDVV